MGGAGWIVTHCTSGTDAGLRSPFCSWEMGENTLRASQVCSPRFPYSEPPGWCQGGTWHPWFLTSASLRSSQKAEDIDSQVLDRMWDRPRTSLTYTHPPFTSRGSFTRSPCSRALTAPTGGRRSRTVVSWLVLFPYRNSSHCRAPPDLLRIGSSFGWEMRVNQHNLCDASQVCLCRVPDFLSYIPFLLAGPSVSTPSLPSWQ